MKHDTARGGRETHANGFGGLEARPCQVHVEGQIVVVRYDVRRQALRQGLTGARHDEESDREPAALAAHRLSLPGNPAADDLTPSVEGSSS